MRAARPVKQWSFLSCWQLPIRSFADNHSGVKPSVFRIHSGDFVTSTLPRHEAIAEIRTKHGINMSKRSARIVENVSRRDTISAIHLRNGYILMKLEYIKCVVLPNRLYLFDAQIPLVHDFAHRIHQALQAGGDEHLSFLLRCIDIALESVTTDYERRLTVFQPVLNAVLTSCGVGAHQTSHPALLRLLPLQNALTNFRFFFGSHTHPMGGDAHAAPVEKPDPAMDSTKALPKAMEELEFFMSYGTRRQTGYYQVARANGSPTILGPMFYNLYNLARLSRVSKYVFWFGLPLVFQRMWMKNRAVNVEYDLDLENYAPYEAKKNPMHGH